MTKIRPAVVSGIFYPENPSLLEKEVKFYLSQANIDVSLAPRALIVPHAGYPYSGKVAGHAYKILENKNFSEIILIGPSHSFSFFGICFSPSDYFQTPLGQVENISLKKILKEEKNQEIKNLLGKIAFESEEIHQPEHCLEVQIPFLQVVLKNPFKIMTILVSNFTSDKEIESIVFFLNKILDRNRLLIISTDLSHYYPYQQAISLDQKTISLILENDEENLKRVGEACGLNALILLLKLAQKRKLQAQLLKYLNSGDITKDHKRVVGYASIAFFEK
ncbi:MAG: AmmeMemoRadiSam system protein B [Minisyncoccia bacterium]